jgi:hypothetical protein
MSASAFSLTLLVPEPALVITHGEPVVGGLHGDDLHHMFCAHCMTWVFTRPVGFGFVNVRPTMLDDARWFAVFAETCVTEKLPWATTGAVHSFEQFPPPDAYGMLMGEYHLWAAPRGIPIASEPDQA